MTYSILSLASGNILESYSSEERAMDAIVRIVESEPQAAGSFAFVAFDDDGDVIETLDGEDLSERIRAHAADRHAATA